MLVKCKSNLTKKSKSDMILFMNKKLIISLTLLVITLVVIITVFKWKETDHEFGQYFPVAKWTATSSGSQGPITYSVKHVPEGYVYSMSGSFGTVSATTTSTTNPFTACQDQFNSTRPEIKDTQASSTENWTNFSDTNYGFSIRYPETWILTEKTIDDTQIILLTNSNHVIQIIPTGKYGSRAVCNQGDYYSIKIGNSYISRSKLPDTYEEGGKKYFDLCSISNSSCDYPINIGSNNLIAITYILQKGNSFDTKLVNEMDSIVETIQPIVK